MKNFFLTLICVIGMITSSAAQNYSESTKFSSGFEVGNTSLTAYVGTTGTVTAGSTTNPRTGTKSGDITSPNSGTYNGSIITSNTITLTAGKFYYIEVYARATQWAGKLKIAKSTTASNSAIANATGTDALLDPATNNVTSTAYTKYTATWKCTTTETVYIGFYMSTTSSGNNKTGKMNIDDIVIKERDYAFYQETSHSSIETISRFQLGNIIDQSSTCTDNEALQSSHINYTDAIKGDLYADSTYSITLTGSTWGAYNNYFNIFIDFNRDGDFDDVFEEYQLGLINNKDCSTGILTTSIQIPSATDLDTGLVLMRVIKKFNTYATSTQSGSGFGETEDYLIRLKIGENPTPLPVVLTQFEASPYPQWNVIKWTTASEQNSDYFSLESSVDGEMWREIAKRPSAGNSTEEIKYSWIDYTQKELTYYRLIQYDIDGKYETYGPIVVSKTINKTIVKYVNLMGQEVNPLTTIGLVIEVYSDGSTKKLIR